MRQVTDQQPLWIDVPSGWKYGFPKIWDRQEPVEKFLKDNGYSESPEWVRCWEATGPPE